MKKATSDGKSGTMFERIVMMFSDNFCSKVRRHKDINPKEDCTKTNISLIDMKRDWDGVVNGTKHTPKTEYLLYVLHINPSGNA